MIGDEQWDQKLDCAARCKRQLPFHCVTETRALQLAIVVRELTYETGRERIGPSSMFGRLTTSRPIRIEDGRDVRGRRGRDGERANKRGVARWPAPRGPCFLRQDNKRYYNATRLPRILHTCHYKWRRGSQLLPRPTSVAHLTCCFGRPVRRADISSLRTTCNP
ncbi:hypothetical protein NDU88_000469 [Pleurodeles waltl]|uniref:Uncharacterized protein n=1 Tax=Pleurodeles waltl TaxID=8319 RepID=A0AAV7THB2_PLEWA|nr:hypothetical protein NDU88_000469 [Pleurodeles waltl]